MFLRDIFNRNIIVEGGNLELPNDQDATNPHRADEIDLKVHNRNYIVPILDKLLKDINDSFRAKYKTPLWSDELLNSKRFLGGSSLHFFNTKGIDDQEFVAKKPKVGDIDTQCNKEFEEKVKEFLTAYHNKQIGDTTLLGFSAGNEQYNALFQFQDPPMKIQIDFEFGRYSPESNSPDEWFRFSHSSDWADISAGIKGVFHKYLYRSLSSLSAKQAYIAKLAGRGKARAVQISDQPEAVNTLSFAVASKQGGGVSEKYKPYIDPATGQPMIKNGLPVLEPVAAADRNYEQKLATQFELFFGSVPTPQDSQLQQSFIGTLDLINKYVDQSKKHDIIQSFLDICFEPGSQMITRDDPQRDAETKFIAIDVMLEKLGMMAMRPRAVQQAKEYEQDYRDVEAFKQANPGVAQPRAAMKKMAVKEAEGDEQPAVKAQFRKGMPHLRDLKPADFLDLLDEIHDGNGSFKLENIPLNVKIDGFGGRFGKNAEGKPFMGTSRTEPRYEPGFLKHHQNKGTTDPEILNRAKSFDDLFAEMMNAIKAVDGKLGPDFLVDRQVTCEVLFLPFATQTDEGKLKFVGIEYDQFPKGVNLVLVPFRIVEASTGEDIPDSDSVIQELADLGQNGSVVFLSNRLVQKDGLDVTEILNPLDNIEELKRIVSDVAGKRDRASLQLRREVEEKLKPIQISLEKAIDEDPNIVGKDMLGKDYEGIVINSRLGPIKVTSQRQKDIITAKNAAKAAARAEQPRENVNKTAVVAIGSFVGHVGHQQLFDYTIKKAEELHGDPYLFMGNAVGKDDPIPVADKVKTWQQLYPQYAKNIGAVTMEGGSLMQKIKHELINPLPGKPPRYDNIVIMVGEDQAKMPIAGALMKAVNKFQGYEHVQVHLEVTPRGTGMSFTQLRNAIKTANPEQAFEIWNKAFNGGQYGAKQLPPEWIKHLMDVTRKGMGIQQQPQQPVPQQPVVEQRLFNALVRNAGPNKLQAQQKSNIQGVSESISIETTLRAITNDIGEPITGIYDNMKFQAKKYIENHGELDNGFNMVMAGISGRWVQTMYIGRLQNELHDLCRYDSRRTSELQQFLRGVKVGSKIELKRSFGNISKELPEILAKIGEQIKYPQLTRNAQRWIQNRTSYNQYIAELDAEDDDEFDSPAPAKTPKNTAVGQQNAQVDQIINQVLRSLPSKVSGDIRNVIARSPNKLQALQAELQKRGVKAPMAEGIAETKRTSNAVKLSKAWDQQRAKSNASLARTPSSIPKKEEPKQEQPTKETVDGGSYAAHKPGYSGQGKYAAQPNWRGMNIGEDIELAMSDAIARLIESQLK